MYFQVEGLFSCADLLNPQRQLSFFFFGSRFLARFEWKREGSCVQVWFGKARKRAKSEVQVQVQVEVGVEVEMGSLLYGQVIPLLSFLFASLHPQLPDQTTHKGTQLLQLESKDIEDIISNTTDNQFALIHLDSNQPHISFIMAFASKGWYLKTDFLMSSILALLGLIVLGTMATKSYTP